MKLFQAILLFVTSLCCVTNTLGQWQSAIHLNYADLGLWNSSGAHMQSGSNEPFEDLDRSYYDYHTVLTKSGTERLAWSFNEENITFKLSMDTSGWMAIGLSKAGQNSHETDYLFMGVINTISYVIDAYVSDNKTYVRDSTQDAVQSKVWETMFRREAIITRPLITCDQHDVDITNDTFRIFWAYGGTDIDETKPLHEQTRDVKESGDLYLKLLNSPTGEFSYKNPVFVATEGKSVTVRASHHDAFRKGRRHCEAFRFGGIANKVHITEFEPLFRRGQEYNVAQIIIRECRRRFQVLTSSESSPIACESGWQQAQCGTILFAWSLGMKNFAFPTNVGYPVATSDSHFVLEILYKRVAIDDSSGMKIHYTSTLREFDAGILTTGSLVHQSQIIPPRAPDFQLQGHCITECIRLTISEDTPVTLFTSTVYTRELGKRIRLRHFRNGVELGPVATDNAFRHESFQTAYLPGNVQLRKGDNLIVECTFNTETRDEITFVNNSQGGESCLAHLGYYPRKVNLTECETAPTESVITRTVGASQTDELLKVAAQFQWTKEKIRIYNEQVLRTQVYVQCGPIQFDEPRPVPQIKKAYDDSEKCPSPPITVSYPNTASLIVPIELTTGSSGFRCIPLISIAFCPYIVLMLLTRLQDT